MENKIKLIALACKTNEHIVEVCLNTNVVNSANKDVKACERLYNFIVDKKYIVLPDFALNSWKIEQQINEEHIADLKAKVSQATAFLTGLKDTPDSATIGDLRSFIDANYKNIIK